ncbi:hypothetical protein DFO66_102167 [Brevibacterium sanguinis]|uniref:Uncharacterized protein n=2 Tax=Brevibacterium TaxID=1696 RepID=A0A366IP14_9MICO|nr:MULTISPECIES: hypothetical protein [Brevibacterium]RBP67114.1 hypothetical protein DFO66_102167 [Brevibacterium sanguinis]RBP73639.1 hypothetical protein DFO65_102167 [Brevibacterium celere]
MITDELARNRDEWHRRANDLRSLAQECREIDVWESPAGRLLHERLGGLSGSIAVLADRADDLAEAYDLHLQVVSVGGRLQI